MRITVRIHAILFPMCILSLIYKYHMSTAPHIIEITAPKFSILGPYNTSRIVVVDNYTQLIDIQNFTFKMNPQPCKDYTADLLLVIIISSSLSNQENRMVIRNTWGQNTDSTKVVFLIGETENVTLAQNITNESFLYKDIVQGNFVDSYRNMTYKHVMGLKWVVHHCPTAKYILKTDDDILVNTRAMTRFLTRELSPWGVKDLIACQLCLITKVHRTKSKWIVTFEEYPFSFYPPFCEGWAVLYSQDVVPRLLKAAQTLPFFWVDDVHITGIIAAQIGVQRTPWSSLVMDEVELTKKWFRPYSAKSLFFGHDLTLEEMMEIWNANSA
ncbi:hypothetical protein PYW08_010734 [Mythimna loreyi]|uniref:Uncharacterized protein n=1 Tax=Mythimna loreyi TaxID=667449 RepID=A0ACC2Q3W5_9NEOP|nr:hypothetical protein PYW08_010734 [Mythimna loreyi]